MINHPSAPVKVRQFFRTASLLSALNVMRAAIQGETQLLSMPNNTAIMISFAACFAFMLSTQVAGESNLAPSIRELIDQTAGVLERIGSITPHRNGPSVMYGRHLREILKGGSSRSAADYPPRNSSPLDVQLAPHNLATGAASSSGHTQVASDWQGPLQFATMSDIEIAQVLDQPGNGFEQYFDRLSWGDMDGFDWLQWPEFVQ